jgi:outer membrane protein
MPQPHSPLGLAARAALCAVCAATAGAQAPPGARPTAPTAAPGPRPNARPLTLQEALALARRNAPAVVQAEGRVRAGQAAVRAARGAFLPSFGLTGSTTEQSPATARLNPATGELVSGRWATNGGVTANVTLFDAFQRQFDLRAARSQQASAQAGVAQQTAATGLQVKQQFFAALAADEALVAARVQRAQADTQLALTRVRVLARTATVADSLQARILVAQAELAEVTATNDRAVADAVLGRLVGALGPVTARADDGPLGGAGDTTLAVDSAAVAALAAAAPQVQQTQAALAAARAGARAARAPYFPTVGLNYGRNALGSSPGFDPLPDNFRFSGQLRLTVTLPLFDQFTRQQALAQAQVTEANADAAARDAQLAATQTVAEQFAAFRTARAQAATQQVTIVAGVEVLRVQRQRYQLGVATVLDVLTAQTQLAQARLALAQARFAARAAKAQLEALVGRDL